MKTTIVRVVLELTSPLSIGSGKSNELRDAFTVLDEHGYPMIPGSSMAGVLRSAWSEFYGEEETRLLFGALEKKGEYEGGDSCLLVSNGRLHDRLDQPVSSSAAGVKEDSLLRAARSPLTRQHVRIGGRGAAIDRGLFDRDVVPTGHRFSLEFRLEWPKKQSLPQDTPDRLLSLLHSPYVSLGAGTRSGTGQFVLKSVRQRTFDLTRKEDFEAFCELPVCLREKNRGLSVTSLGEIVPFVPQHGLSLELDLTPRKSWQIGGGNPTEKDVRKERGKPADIIPWREPQVEWETGGTLTLDNPTPVVPGTSVKGPLRHRTCYYYHLLSGKTVSDLEGGFEAMEEVAHQSLELWPLFGGVPLDKGGKDKDEKDEGEKVRQMAGSLTVEDVEILNCGKHGFQDHVTLDRFTGGAYRGHLFDESFYWGGQWKIRLHLKDRKDSINRQLRLAFARAVVDLCTGRLQVGAGDARGHGRLELSDSSALQTKVLQPLETWVEEAEKGEA
jgi:CRISPR/Cas system CSM-associated protein Csm3 (group 7 of RAMP superfamily)